MCYVQICYFEMHLFFIGTVKSDSSTSRSAIPEILVWQEPTYTFYISSIHITFDITIIQLKRRLEIRKKFNNKEKIKSLRLIIVRSEEHTSELQSRFDLVC